MEKLTQLVGNFETPFSIFVKLKSIQSKRQKESKESEGVIYFFNLPTTFSKCLLYVRQHILYVLGAGDIGMVRRIYLSVVWEGKQTRKSVVISQSVKVLQEPDSRGEAPKLSGSGVCWGLGMKAAQRRGCFRWALKVTRQPLSTWGWEVAGMQGTTRRGVSQDNKKNPTCQRPEIQCIQIL